MAGMLRGATAPGHPTAASCHRRRARNKNGQQQPTVVRGRKPGLRWLQRKVGEIHCTYMDSPCKEWDRLVPAGVPVTLMRQRPQLSRGR
jgi:hypothetical protein